MRTFNQNYEVELVLAQPKLSLADIALLVTLLQLYVVSVSVVLGLVVENHCSKLGCSPALVSVLRF